MTHTEKDDLVEHCYCEDLVDEERDATGSHGTIGKCDWCKAATRITELQAQLKEAREALKPIVEKLKYAEASLLCDGGVFVDTDTIQIYANIGDLRRAAHALAGTEAYAAAVDALETPKPRD